MTSGDDIVREWIEECVRVGTIPASALTRFDEIRAMTARDYRRLLEITRPDQDRGWSVDDLHRYARGMRRSREHADALMQITMHSSASAPWVEAVATLKRVSEAADGLPWGDAHS